MRGPKPPAIDADRRGTAGLAALVRRHTTPQQVALRARLVLAAAAGRNNAQIARQEGVEVETARLWRGRWLGLRAVALADLRVEERLADAPRSGRRADHRRAGMSDRGAGLRGAGASGRPISQWTGREVAAEVIKRGIVEPISPRHAARLLKRGPSSRIASATG